VDLLGGRPRRALGRAALTIALLAALACGGGGGDDEAERGDADRSTTTEEGTTATSSEGAATTVPAEAPPVSEGGDVPATPAVSWVATAAVPTVEVFDEPDGEPAQTLDHPNENGAPLVFLVDGEPDGDWVPVNLPVRPNGSTGWVRAGDVTLSQNPYRIRVELDAHRITLIENGQPMLNEAIGVGTAETPTPGGVYYVKELLQPPDPDGAYGPYAYGLSGFSNELTSFAGGEGVIGIHGTNDPDSVGSDVSHGCIRVTNDTIQRLVDVVPLGTPVEILT
jgi:lipoprotein-anchoring transpeptidase ErfK/SrfK